MFRFVKNPLRNCSDLDGIMRTIKGNSFEICRKEMERCKDTGSLKPENIDKKQVVKGELTK